MPAKGTERSATTGRFHEAKFHCPFSGHESRKAKVASVPTRDAHALSLNQSAI